MNKFVNMYLIFETTDIHISKYIYQNVNKYFAYNKQNVHTEHYNVVIVFKEYFSILKVMKRRDNYF